MEQQIIRNEKLNEQYVQYRHESGLTILLYPMKGYSSSYALFGTKLGSIDTAFKTDSDSEYTTVPEGVAHFLEHKLFESEEGDAFSLFAKTGASANAYTSFEKTCYLFSTTDNFDESLKSLLTFVQEPYFTQQTVEKEQGIIGQEIRMYDDDPGWRVFFNLLQALYVNNPVRIDIAGTVESIAQIDADLLYKCYNTFYNLNNMVLAIAGNFEIEPTLKIIQENLKVKDKVQVQHKLAEEPNEIASERTVQALSVSVPLFHIGFKEQVREGAELLRVQLACEILLDILAGEGSRFYRTMYDAGLINQTFGCEVFCGRGYFSNIFAGESKKPDEVFEKLQEEIRRLRQEGIPESDFSRAKKSLYGRLVRSFNNVETVANTLVNCYFAEVGIYDSLQIIEDMTRADLTELLKTVLQEDKAAISIIEPVQE